MIIEHELIEQIECDELGWSLARACELLLSHGKPEPLTVVDRMVRAGHIAIVDAQDEAVPDWKWQALCRAGDTNASVQVICTPAGIAWVYG